MKIKAVRICPICKRQSYMNVDRDKADMIGLVPIQDLFPELNVVERKFLKSGYCNECQYMLFGNGKTRKVRYTK